MALIFILLTQLINQTPFNLDFEVDHGRRLLPELRRGKTRYAKPSLVLRQLRHFGRDWKIRVLIDGEFTGIELHPQLILNYVRLVFRVDGDGDGDVLCVEGVRENRGNDFLLRHRFFGCMRNFYWNSRPLESIDRSDSKLATKLRNMKGHCRYLAPFVDINLEKRYPSTEKESPRKEHDPPMISKIIKPPPVQQERSRDEPRPLNPLVDSEKQVRSRDPRPLRSPMEIEENGIKRPRLNGTLKSHQARVRDDHPRPLRPNSTLTSHQARPRMKESPKKEHDPPIISKIIKSPPAVQQERSREPRPLNPLVDSEKQVRSRDPRPLRSPMEIEENGIKRPRPNGTLKSHQARVRDDHPRPLRPNGTLTSHQARMRDDRPRPLNRPMDSQKQLRPRDEPRPLEPLTGEIGIKSLRPNDTATAQQARPRDGNNNVVDKDSFVHGLIIVFCFLFCMLLKLLF